MEEPPWAKVVVYSAQSEDAVLRTVEQARGADLVVKASGVGVHDELLERAVPDLQAAGTMAAFWDLDAPATLDRVHGNTGDAFRPLIPRYDMVPTYGGGEPVRSAYLGLGARDCVPIYNALDPGTHHPVAPEPRFECDLAAQLPERRMLIGGSGGGDKPMPANVHDLGHVYTADHNAFNCFFEPGREVLDAARAREIGQAALRRVLSGHTYAHRAAQLDAVLEGCARAPLLEAA